MLAAYPIHPLLPEKRADRFRGFSERGVLRIHQDLGHNRHGGLVQSPPPELVAHGLLDLISYGPLRVRAAVHQRDRMHPLRLLGDLRTAQDKADLRAVAVGDDHVVAALDHIRDMDRRLTYGRVLIRYGLMSLIPDQRVSSDRDHRQLAHRSSLPLSLSRFIRSRRPTGRQHRAPTLPSRRSDAMLAISPAGGASPSGPIVVIGIGPKIFC